MRRDMHRFCIQTCMGLIILNSEYKLTGINIPVVCSYKLRILSLASLNKNGDGDTSVGIV
jgi:hypothetical protein